MGVRNSYELHINGGKLNKGNLITSIIAYTNKGLRVRLVFIKALT